MRKLILAITLFTLLIPTTVLAQEDTTWGEVFDDTGAVRPDVTDLGVTTDHPDWMSVDLPFGQSLDLEANYHIYETANGSTVVMPSATTLFFMAMNPVESGLAASDGMASNGYGSMISFLGHVAGDSVDWNAVANDHPEYSSPDQFWNAVISGEQDVWTYFSGWNFISNLASLSLDDEALRTAYLLYEAEAQECSVLPNGCPVDEVETPEPAETSPRCPDPKVNIQPLTASIQKTGPAHPLVIGQDPERKRGADISASVSVPPVIFTWYEPVYEEKEICKYNANGVYVCNTKKVFKECRKHVENLPDRVVTLQASASLDSASRAWITGQLGQTHYGAYLHKPDLNLVPGISGWSGGCTAGGSCSASANVTRAPFADPGTFNLTLQGMTSGTRFMGIQVSEPRPIQATEAFQVSVTLPALIP